MRREDRCQTDLSCRDKKSYLITEHGLYSQLKQLWKSKGHFNAGDASWTAALATIIAMIGMQVLVNLTTDSENHPLEISDQP